MTLVAPRSRQGRLMLVLAFLAATVAVVGTFVWASNAQANVPTGVHTIVTVTDNNAGTANPGGLIAYTVTITTDQAATGTTTNPTLELQADPDLWPVSFGDNGAGNGPWDLGDCVVVGGVLENDIKCVGSGAVDDDVITINYVVIPFKDNSIAGPNDQPAPECEVYDDGDGAGNGKACAYALGSLETTINDYTITPKDAENGPGQDHFVSIDLPAGFDCESDSDYNDTPRECTAGDVHIVNTNGATATLVDGPNVSGGTFSTGSVNYTINSPTTGDVEITVDLVYVTGFGDNPEFYDLLVDPVATKTYGIVAEGETARLRHVDLPDMGTEDVADIDLNQEEQPYCSDVLEAQQPGGQSVQGTNIFDGVCGVLNGQDDIDDAIGSFHGACIIGSLLTWAANDSDITWHITPVPGPGPVPASISTFAGPNGEPCVMWGAGTTGTQQITAVYHEGDPDQENFFWDYNPNLPLIKEWNTIDSTRIVTTSGDLGDSPPDVILGNTGGADDWFSRDCSLTPEVPVGGGDCTLSNLDGLTMQVEGSLILNGNSGTFIRAEGRTFIDYTMGHHADAGGAYEGPVDGAQQTYSVYGDCGSIRLEDPTTGAILIVNEGGSQTVLSSDKGVAFEFEPNNDGALSTTIGNSDCGPNALICVDIDTIEDNLFHSPPLSEVDTETICVQYTVGPPTSKTPLLAWAGQRVIVEHYWGDPATGECLITPTGTRGGNPAFGVQYSKQNGKGGFTAMLLGNAHDIDQTNDDVVVHVNVDPQDDNGPQGEGDGITDPNSNCTSRVIYESEDETEADLSAYIVNDNDDVGNSTPQSQQVPFVIYFLKFEDVKLSIVPEDSDTHEGADASVSAVQDSSDDVTDITANVSSDVLARVRVRGYVETQNCPARDSAVGQNGEFLPANRCIFPDDWQFKAGGAILDSTGHVAPSGLNDATDGGSAGIAEESRPNFDINKLPSRSYLSNTIGCQSPPSDGGPAEGPFSLLDGLVTSLDGGVANNGDSLCGDSLAPYVPEGGGFPDATMGNCLTMGLTYDCRETVFPDGIIDAWDAQMPPALVRFLLTGSGFLHGADKELIYSGNSNPFYDQNIPAEPWIDPINEDLEGYQWNSYGAAGGKDGPFHFWTSLAAHGPAVGSCAGEGDNDGFTDLTDTCADGSDPVSTCSDFPVNLDDCGYRQTKVYTDNHGEAMTWINGDADLSFEECDSSTPTENDHNIVLLHGFYCESGDVVGHSTLNALVDYPDKRKHFAIDSDNVTIDWTWGGIKEVTVCQDLDATHSCEPETPGVGSQYHYVVFHVTDRDGFCNGNSLHPVLGEEVDFRIDSTTGSILPNVNGDSVEGPPSTIDDHAKSATTHTFNTGSNQSVENGGITVEPVIQDDPAECQSWIHVSESLLNQVNVIVTAFDPEGTVTFDTKDINPTAVPTAPPTASPAPTPVTFGLKWGDSDCSGDIMPRDAQAILKHVLDLPELSVNQPCPGMGQEVIIDGVHYNWADWDCTGQILPRDAQAVLKNVLSLTALSQTEPCPDVGSTVQVEVVSLP